MRTLSVYLSLAFCLFALASGQDTIKKDKEFLVKEKVGQLAQEKIIKDSEAARLRMKEALKSMAFDERSHIEKVAVPEEEIEHRRNELRQRRAKKEEEKLAQDAEKINQEILNQIARLKLQL